jgi:hypothetical protein
VSVQLFEKKVAYRRGLGKRVHQGVSKEESLFSNEIQFALVSSPTCVRQSMDGAAVCQEQNCSYQLKGKV